MILDMRRLLLLLAINLFIFDLQANRNNGDIEFSLKKLEDIASQIPSKYLVDQDTIMVCPEICGNKSIVIQYNAKHQVSHLGISMFSKETKEIINQPVCDFVERFLLELALTDNSNEIIAMLNHYSILLQRNGRKFGEGNVNSINAILNEINDPVYFTLSKDDKTYTVAWEYGQQNIFAIQFPLNRELITGANKLESDNDLYDQLKDNNCDKIADITKFLTNASDLTSNDGSIYINKGDTFMLGFINENTYYKKTNSGYELIYDENFPNESLSNLFMGNVENNSLKIKVRHSMYDNFTPEYEMNLKDFICFFRNDFKIYTASSYQREPGVVNSTVIFQNKQYNYIHLLTISTKKENIFDANGVITASFRSNIPMHNINNIVGDLIRNN